ncbi:MAG: tetratricopeptide repeat protein [Terrimicrobiaceae bacterium]
MRPVFYQRRWEPNLGLSRHTIYRILFWLLIGFVAYKGFLFGKGIIDSLRATRLADQAEIQVAAGATAKARDTLKEALSLDESNPRAARLMARLLDAEENPVAVEYHGLVAESGEATVEDFRLAALSAAKHGQTDQAAAAAAKNREMGGDPAFPELIQAQILALNGDSAGREKALRAAVEANESSESLTALADFLMADSELYDLNGAEAIQLLRRAGEIDKGPPGLQSLRKALLAQNLPASDRAAFLALYRAHPAADTLSRLDASGIEMAANPASRASVVREALESFRKLPLAERLKAARWFLDIGEPGAVIEILPIQQASSGPGGLRLWVDAATALGDWSAVEVALGKPTPSLDESVRLPLLARAIKQQGRVTEADAVYAEALRSTESNPQNRAEVLASLLGAGEWELFQKNLTPVVNNPLIASAALRSLVPVARDHRSSARLLGFYEQALRSPVLAKDPYLLDRFQFCRHILGIPVPIEEVEARMAQAGENPNYLATAALGHLKNGRKARAMHILEGGEKPLDISKMTPSRQAAAAAVYAANDRVAEAQKIAARIPRQKLTMEEVEFLDLALARGGMIH